QERRCDALLEARRGSATPARVARNRAPSGPPKQTAGTPIQQREGEKRAIPSEVSRGPSKLTNAAPFRCLRTDPIQRSSQLRRGDPETTHVPMASIRTDQERARVLNLAFSNS